MTFINSLMYFGQISFLTCEAFFGLIYTKINFENSK